MLKQIDPVVEGLDLPLELLAPSFESLQIVGRGFEVSDAALKPREYAGRRVAVWTSVAGCRVSIAPDRVGICRHH